MKNIRLINSYHKIGNYHSRSWALEDSVKYVFTHKGHLIEAGYYIHYSDDRKNNPIKHVIELSTSYGCPFHCRFCASSSIDNVSVLEKEVVYEVFSFIYNLNNMVLLDDIEVSFMGIGDVFFTQETVLSAIPLILRCNDKIRFNISSCCWTKSMLERFEQYRNCIKTLQITFVNLRTNRIRELIPGFLDDDYNIGDVLQTIYEFNFEKIRINYLMINGFNDGDNDILQFLNIVKQYRNKITVRISRMNITRAAIDNNLQSSTMEKMKRFEDYLLNEGINAYLFYSYQNDNMSCGQLITELKDNV